jgi:REP-associated tyrosine transposase
MRPRSYGALMPRQARRDVLPEVGVFHVVSRGVADTRIFGDDRDRRLFLRLLGMVTRVFERRCEVFCLMNTHYHAVFHCHREPLAAALHRLNGRYASAFNKRYRRRGHLFADRYSAWIVESDEHLVATIRYVIANPVRAGLCEDPLDWRWSGSRYGRDVF